MIRQNSNFIHIDSLRQPLRVVRRPQIRLLYTRFVYF